MKWSLVQITECARIVGGSTPDTNTPSYWGGDIPWATPKDLSDLDSATIRSTPRMITGEGLASCSSELLPAGSVLFSSRAPIGHVAINAVPMATNQGFKSFVPIKEKLDAKFLYHWLRANKSYLQSLGNGATFKEVSKEVVSRISIPLPPVEEQRRIAAILDQAEALRAKRRQALAKLDTLTQSLFLEMFGDPVRNDMQWEKKTAIDYADCIVPGRDKPKSFTGATPWVTTADLRHLGYTERSRYQIGLSEDEIKEVRARIVPKSSVLLTCVGDLGVISINKTNMVINQQLHSFQLSDEMNEEFFMHALAFQKDYMYRNASQTTLPYMNKTVCNGIPMIRPPKELQLRFAEAVRAVDRIRDKYQQSLNGNENLIAVLNRVVFKNASPQSNKPSGAEL